MYNLAEEFANDRQYFGYVNVDFVDELHSITGKRERNNPAIDLAEQFIRVHVYFRIAGIPMKVHHSFIETCGALVDVDSIL